MIRLIACDLDGTLLTPEGTLPEGIFPMIRALREKGVRFAAASGRQFGNLYRMFAPAAEQMEFLCENGAVIRAAGQTLTTRFPRPMAEEIIRDILDAGMELLLCTPEVSYLCADASREYTDDMFYRLRNNCALTADPFLYAGEAVKISGYLSTGVEPLAPPLQAKWRGRAYCDIAGPEWLDFTLTNKGTGIAALSEALDIPLSDCAAFGDQFNDEAMLDRVGHPYVMVTAPAPLLRKGYAPCLRVMDTLAEILAKA